MSNKAQAFGRIRCAQVRSTSKIEPIVSGFLIGGTLAKISTYAYKLALNKFNEARERVEIGRKLAAVRR
jgi:hypothetical protein